MKSIRRYERIGTISEQRQRFGRLPVATDTMVIRCFRYVSHARRAWLAFCASAVFDQAVLDAQE